MKRMRRRIEYKLVRDSNKPYRTIMNTPADTYKYLKNLMNADREKLVVIFLDGKNEAIAIDYVSVGTEIHAIVHPSMVFRGAVMIGASAIILAHNHPSGNLHFSDDDWAITREIINAGKILKVRVLDHILIGDGYRSMKEIRDIFEDND